jgi:glycosyltransferase involved in cell wall biosynthesis
LLTPIGDAEAMGEVVMYLATNETQRKSMAQASRQQAMEFRWEKVAEQVREVYRTVAG